MAKHLTEDEVNFVLSLIDNWDKNVKFTWNEICFRYEKGLKRVTTRQRLERNNRIKLAYIHKKRGITDEISKEQKHPPSLKLAGQRIERLEAELRRIKNENSALLEQFKVWQYNAYIHGLSVSDLNKSLPSIDRESS